MTYVMVDIEANGPVPGLYSMISLGAVIVEPGLDRTFYAQFQPLAGASVVPEALAVSGHTQEECQGFPEPYEGMKAFKEWIEANCGTRNFRGQEVPDARFISDNNGFDWMFVRWYFHKFLGECPFGHSSTNLGRFLMLLALSPKEESQ